MKTNDETTELLNCPFCGGKAELGKGKFEGCTKDQLYSSRDRFSTGFWITCTGCDLKMGWSEAYDDCEGGDFKTAQEAIQTWNIRHPQSSAQQFIAEALKS